MGRSGRFVDGREPVSVVPLIKSTLIFEYDKDSDNDNKRLMNEVETRIIVTFRCGQSVFKLP